MDADKDNGRRNRQMTGGCACRGKDTWTEPVARHDRQNSPCVREPEFPLSLAWFDISRRAGTAPMDAEGYQA